MSDKPYGHGALTDEDKERIEQLAGEGLNSCEIARRINRHQSTVQWFMYSTGLKGARPAAEKPSSYVRRGRVVHRFTVAEDEFIVSLREQGVGLTEIARRASERFGTNRNVHSVHVRLVMIAGRDEDAA